MLTPKSLCKFLLRVNLLFELADECEELVALIGGRNCTENELMDYLNHQIKKD